MTVITKNAEKWPLLEKSEVAELIVDKIEKFFKMINITIPFQR